MTVYLLPTPEGYPPLALGAFKVVVGIFFPLKYMFPKKDTKIEEIFDVYYIMSNLQ